MNQEHAELQKRAAARLEADRVALGRHTEEGLGDLALLQRTIAEQQGQGGDMTRSMSLAGHGARRRIMVGLATAGLVAALLVVPIPYSRTVGHGVRLEFDGASDAQAARAAARTLRERGRATGIRVRRDDGGPGGRPRTVVEGEVPLRSRRQLEALTSAIADGLTARGLTARVEISPRTERAHGSVYAMARDKAPEIRIDTAQSVDELRASIRRQIEEAGLEAAVQVDRAGDETRVEITAERNEAGGLRTMKKVRVHLRGDGEARANLGGPPLPRAAGMSDEQYRDAIREELRRQGMPDAEVTVDGERVEVRVRREEPAGAE